MSDELHARLAALTAERDALERKLAVHRELLQEMVDYCTEPAGLTVELVRDPVRFAAFHQVVEERRAHLLARAYLLLLPFIDFGS